MIQKEFDERIEINSPGELLRPLKIEEIKRDNYVPLSRNKTIIEILGKFGVMDKRGTGFLRIREAMKKYNLPKPEFEEKMKRLTAELSEQMKEGQKLDQEIKKNLETIGFKMS